MCFHSKLTVQRPSKLEFVLCSRACFSYSVRPSQNRVPAAVEVLVAGYPDTNPQKPTAEGAKQRSLGNRLLLPVLEQ